MPVKDKVESWIVETPKHLVTAMFALASTGIVLVLVTLFVIAPRIAAIPDETGKNPEPSASASAPTDSRLLVEVKGSNYRNHSTLNMGIIGQPSPENLAGNPGKAPHESPDANPNEVPPGATLNLAGLDNLQFPTALTSDDSDTDAETIPEVTSKWQRQRLESSVKTNQVSAGQKVEWLGMQAFFDDLTKGNFTQMQRNCWTITPEVFTDRYATKPAQVALVQALGTSPKVTDTGVKWHGNRVDVTAPWTELASRYTCPNVAYGGKVDAVTTQDVSYVMERLMTRRTTPVSPSDREDIYPLVCPHWNPPAAITEFSPKAREKLVLDENKQISPEAFKVLQAIRTRSLHIYAVKDEYPMYLRVSESQLKEPSAYFFRDAAGFLCIGSIVGLS